MSRTEERKTLTPGEHILNTADADAECRRAYSRADCAKEELILLM